MLLNGMCNGCANNKPDGRTTKIHPAEGDFPWEPGEANRCKKVILDIELGVEIPPGKFDNVHWNMCMECSEYRTNS